ncbi:MAG: class I mannose-6-phosphate isomerase [Haliscomenobacter sp.]|nr:class I mannose-6-phosphate isomerase [Haliscomenobacter sp.]
MDSNYDKFPYVEIEGFLREGWGAILAALSDALQGNAVLAVDCYPGVWYAPLKGEMLNLPHSLCIDTADLMKPEPEILRMTAGFVTGDALFGYMSNLEVQRYFDPEKLQAAKDRINAHTGTAIVFGYGAALVGPAKVLVYADMPRWEIQLRMRKHLVDGLGVQNRHEPFSLQYKRGLFNDWRVCDKHKRTLYGKADFWLDTTWHDSPRLIDKATFHAGLNKTASMPFRVTPFFDPAPWGGQWMKTVCDLDRSAVNYGWCFDCVPEENSLRLKVNGVDFDMPSINLVLVKSRELLGEQVEARFGKEFPIRFDFLDTMEGGNLSLQVHPITQYAQEHFGIPYTQDESYYLLDAAPDACVYLGLKERADKNRLIADLETAREDPAFVFDAEKYVYKIPAQKHDHFLIPAGTIHCSGKNAMVLEISATPFIYTFKLWDWQRMGLDGKPRPNNVHRGKEVINWNRDARDVMENLVNQFVPVAAGDGWAEEKTGLHPTQFIETRRHSFTKKVQHHTESNLNVLNLVEGREVLVESPEHAFEPVVIHYAETFIVPAAVGPYTIRPYGTAEGTLCKTMKAFVRTA